MKSYFQEFDNMQSSAVRNTFLAIALLWFSLFMTAPAFAGIDGNGAPATTQGIDSGDIPFLNFLQCGFFDLDCLFPDPDAEPPTTQGINQGD
jgi:hypothetical protein